VAEKPVPEAWVGKDVIVLAGEGLDPLPGPLLEVNDRGVVIEHLLNLDELEERHARGEDKEALRQEMQRVDMLIPWPWIKGIYRTKG
jgi:hypothetical protein